VGSPKRLEGQVALITGAGRGLGREHALVLAEQGAHVVVNDIGAALDGSGRDLSASEAVAAEITAAGGRALVDGSDCGDWDAAEALVTRIIDTFGRLDILLNNAGILRPRTIVRMSEAEWSDVIRVHLFATFALTHFAAVHWRARSTMEPASRARLINTTSSSGIFSNGQANYASAKAAVAALTLIAADELGAYGVTANAIAPIAFTRMSTGIVPESFTPRSVSMLVAWLASPEADSVTGRVFSCGGGHVSVVDGWHTGPSENQDSPFTLEELDAVVPRLVAQSAPRPDFLGYFPDEPRSANLPSMSYPDPTPSTRPAPRADD
jgi:NAD(P)-dependent dehydrogenase (short-subunit alcohol dehydrogenase family)